ncbi:MAG: hypothetical protein A2939_00855 [Parcubacteria group bacterium RIFCSPLOWO2_01_FULL_48_18]|nr:MAG: hypothetical protein A3J67_04495 [Parcubacteria group bacterium RIFCSPHIGHO2_02_FULL_48_10b]OHB22025.1 MAG: hypothetical protein A2939_00855 [Parcubacteria group bacterium RIFCSPLOWO2_01_FULL_48_18]
MILYDYINQYIDGNDIENLDEFILSFTERLNGFDFAAWIELYRLLIVEMNQTIEQMPEALQPPPDTLLGFIRPWKNMVKAHLIHENPFANNYILEKIALQWRNRFIFNNMKSIADIAARECRDVVFIIGFLHVPELYEKLGSNYRIFTVSAP